jgi:hypothetical protein
MNTAKDHAADPAHPRDHEFFATANTVPARPRDAAKILNLKAGDLVEIRSAAEIIASLDVDGKLDGLPFMPEMERHCGRRFRVSRRADNTCAGGQPRRIENTVHLEALRCDGSGHFGCQAACLMLWKEAWLQRVAENRNSSAHRVERSVQAPVLNGAAAPNLDGNAADRERIHRVLSETGKGADGKLVCQATELNAGTCSFPLGHSATYLTGIVRDYRAAKIGRAELRVLWTYLRGKLILAAFTAWAQAPWNTKNYKTTPSECLSLQPGEWVRVRSAREILRTLDRKACNRGMEFKAEMFQFCGRKFPVLARLERRIDERTGMMREFRNECILLTSVYCLGQRSFCARGNYHYWREIWLRRC